jgi:phosphopantothenoylcysteine decarboxylase/phosphopantothenate--cysteine ligase
LRASEFTAVVMAAAVSDYRPAEAIAGKISSRGATLTLKLERTEKILPRLKTWSIRPPMVIGFKLTVDADDRARRAAVAAQFSAGGVDAVVHNDLAEMRAATQHPFYLWRAAETPPVRMEGAAALAAALEHLIGGAAA